MRSGRNGCCDRMLGAILPLHDVRYRAGFIATHAKRFSCERAAPAGGARRDRTDDLLLAKQALSQLSYGPVRGQRTDDGEQKEIPSSVVCGLAIGGPGKT